ncbi:MAG: potassium transporter Trk [Actinomycetota bacterium]
MSSTRSDSSSTQSEMRIRRAPRIPVFLLLGALLGFVVTLILTASFPTDPTLGFPATFGYFLLYGVPAGVVIGATVGIVLDRISSRRAKNVVVERTLIDIPDED